MAVNLLNNSSFDKTYRVFSRDRLQTSVSRSNFEYRINIVSSQNLRALITRAVIPKVYLNLPTDSTITITEQNNVTSVLTLPKGNYDIDSIALSIKTLLNAHTTNASVYTATASQVTGKITFTCSKLPCVFRIDSSRLESMLGISKNTNYNFNFTSTNIVIMNQHDVIFIESNLISGDKTMAVIPVAQNLSWDFITYKYQEAFIDSRRVTHRDSDVYVFKLLDSDRKEIDLEGLDWSFDLHIYEDVNAHQHEIILKIDDFIQYATHILQKVDLYIDPKDEMLPNN